MKWPTRKRLPHEIPLWLDPNREVTLLQFVVSGVAKINWRMRIALKDCLKPLNIEIQSGFGMCISHWLCPIISI
jgi:hypothetical protein